MIITDLTNFYIQHTLDEQNLEKYENVFPELFEHYFRFWAQKDYWHQELHNEQVAERKKLVIDQLPYIESRLSSHGFDTKNLQIVIMVGQGTTNGHAFKYKNEFAVFLPIEGYQTIEQVNIFVTHEIIHALHYSFQPDFFFSTQEEKESVLRQLITEGLATYLTKEVLDISEGEALWADYLSVNERSKWLDSCKKMRQELLEESKKFIEENSVDADLFYANDSHDVRKYRAGYFIGLEIIKEVVKKDNLSERDLMSISRRNFELIAKDVLKSGNSIV